MAIGLLGVGLPILMIQGMDVSAQQILSNGSVHTTSNTTLSNTTNSTLGATDKNNAANNAFDQLKDTFGSLFGK